MVGGTAILLLSQRSSSCKDAIAGDGAESCDSSGAETRDMVGPHAFVFGIGAFFFQQESVIMFSQ